MAKAYVRHVPSAIRTGVTNFFANVNTPVVMVNDALQGNVRNIGFLFGGTPEFLMDTRRGLYSYPALESRLAENSFALKPAVLASRLAT